MKVFNVFMFSVCWVIAALGQNSIIKGKLVDENNKPIAYASVMLEGTSIGGLSKESGEYILSNVDPGKYKLNVSFIGYKNASRTIQVTKKEEVFNFVLVNDNNTLSDITIYGKTNKNIKEVQNLTRLPLPIQDQIQNITIISDQVIKEQGALSITDATRNVAGVTQFASYGGVNESMTIRGFRGTPVLKNGVSLDSDFRTASAISDMQGVESIQVLKGSASIGQGIGNGLGSAGGVINVITKTPNFVNKREIGFRAGSYGQIRPTVDVEQILDKKEKVSIRFNGAYERNDGFRIHTGSDKVYVNPSITYKIDDKTTLTAEFDYLDSHAVADRGTVNLAPDTQEKIYKMPHDKFLGFKGDYYDSKIMTYGARLQRELNSKLSVRVSSFNSISKIDSRTVSVSRANRNGTTVEELKWINRGIAKNKSKDENSVFQVDLVGKDIITGFAKHTFQVGFDFRQTVLTTDAFDAVYNGQVLGKNGKIDTIDVLGPISNEDPTNLHFDFTGATTTTTPTYGFMAQDYVELGQYVKALVGVRYSRLNGVTTKNASVDRWNPIFGLILSPTQNINLFGSYTTTTSLRQSNYKLEDGSFAGPQDTQQVEFGVKSSWLNDQLLVNVTYFDATNKNVLAQVYTENGTAVTDTYQKAGNLARRGVEVDINGKITNSLEVMLGYAFLDAKYDGSPIYQNGSAPMNAAKHSANGWVNYKLNDGALKGLSFGAGAYFVGKRPVNEFNLKPDAHGSMVGEKPFDMPDFTTVNAQIAYSFKNATLRVFANNIFNKTGYTSYYRGGYINETAPRNFAAQLTYRF
ncbi:TonB-dependent siderophore receptor [Myroides sp. LJL119]